MGSTCKQGKPNGNQKTGGYRIGQKTIQKAKRKRKGATYLTNNKKGGIKRSLPVLTWISGDGIRRPEATSSRGRSLALADRLARIFGAQYEILFSCKTRSDKEKLQRLLRSKILALTFS
uniref:Uncharacterized protein n=1 Tax=Gossypium raimondii TaxID=29730 RepID=A0A0D2QRA4_GOSRA|nr:hypothetical protein B456_001G162600 [Gossypium raimondii]